MRITRNMLGSVFAPRSMKLDDELNSPYIGHGVVEFDLRNGTVRVPEGTWTIQSLTHAMDLARRWQRQYRIESGLHRFSDEVLMEMDRAMRQPYEGGLLMAEPEGVEA